MSTLSVLMANYNYAHYVSGALKAILAQSYRPLEVIVIDDGSTDNSVEVIGDIADRHPSVRFFRNDRNRGVLYTANRALSLASGDYVYTAAADDRVLPGLFEKSMEMLCSHSEAGLCCSDPATFDHSGTLSDNPNRWSDRPCYLSPDSLADVLKGGFIAGHTSIARRSVMLELGGFRTDLKWACDWFLWLIIGFRYGLCYIPEPLAAFRRNLNSFSAVGERDQEQHAEVLMRLLTLVRSPEYRDVLPYFVRSGVFHHFGPRLVQLVLSRPELWNLETVLLLLFPLYEWVGKLSGEQERLRANLRQSLMRLVPRVVGQCRRDNVQRIVVYGAGSHTEMLLPLWRQAKGAGVARIIVTEAADAREFMGLPVTRANEYRPDPGDGIVLSSYTYEVEMAAMCRKLWPMIPYYPLYHPKPGQEAAPEPEPALSSSPAVRPEFSGYLDGYRARFSS